MKKTRLFLVLALMLCLISSVGAYILQTDGGKVEVTELMIPGSDGASISGWMYKPVAATQENPLPLIITGHGSYNNKEMQDQNLIELSRRGFVVFAPDSYRHGKSSIHSEDMSEYTSMVDTVETLYASLNYIDKDKIAVTGHSMGADQANNTARYYIEQEAKGEGVNKISAVLSVGCDPPYTFYEREDRKEPIPITVDYGVIAAKYDEWFFRQPDVDNNPARLLESENARSFVNQVDAKVTGPVENGRIYEGTIEGETYKRVLYQVPEIHPMNHFSRNSAAAMVDYFYEVFGVPSGFGKIASGSQIWIYKELFNLLGLIGIFLFLFPFSKLLLSTKFFGEIRTANAAPPAPALRTVGQKGVFWLTVLVNTALPALLLMPIGFHLIGKETFVPAVYNRLFGEGNTNELAGWSLMAGLCILAVLFLVYRVYGKKRGAELSSWGIRISPRRFLKALLLACLTVFSAYGILFISNYFFGTDFRFWVLAMKTFGPDKLLYALAYLPAFAVFYLVNSIAVNGNNRVEGWKEWKVLLLSCISNIMGLVVLIAIQYASILTDGNTVFNSMRIVNLFPLLVLIPAATLISRQYFKETGSIYTGSLVFGLFYSVMTSANTMFTASLFSK
ncbi:alpha/beta hydrolase [Diplocloster hominis]|uniref:alpha/beta hydrolase n=1 Tax=Diplocloster hominis TaxID=3079010 RepID=UPI0031BA6788